MQNEIGLGIVGCGAISKRHGEALSQLPEARLKAVADLNTSRAGNFARSHTRGSKVEVHENHLELLSSPGIDAVIVATPTGLHAQIGLDALSAGKHVLIEKPLVLKAEDAKKLIAKAKEVGKTIDTVHPNRYYPTSRMVKEVVTEGRLGKLSHGVATLRWNRSQAYYDEAPWRKTRDMDGGILFNQAWHALDLLLWFMGSPVVKVGGLSSKRFHDIETEDLVLGTLLFENGALGLVEATTNVYPRNLEQTISLFGEKGTVILGGDRIDALRTWRVEGESEEDLLSRWGPEVAPRHGGSWAHGKVLFEFLSNIRSNTLVSDSVYSALELIKCINALLGLE